eukprot:1194339-Prorocentrum_minimum.AAC.1
MQRCPQAPAYPLALDRPCTVIWTYKSLPTARGGTLYCIGGVRRGSGGGQEGVRRRNPLLQLRLRSERCSVNNAWGKAEETDVHRASAESAACHTALLCTVKVWVFPARTEGEVGHEGGAAAGLSGQIEDGGHERVAEGEITGPSGAKAPLVRVVVQLVALVPPPRVGPPAAEG